MSAFTNLDNRLQATEQATKWWWVFLVTGILWLIVSLIVFRFDIASVQAVGILIACVVIVAGVNEFMAIGVTQGGWKVVHGVLGALFIVFGLAALVYPGRTFVTLAAILGWVLLFMGIFQILTAFMTRHENELWWLQLIVGAAAILLAFWSAGYFGRRVILLIAFTGAWALIRGVSEIVLAFQVRALHKRIQSGAVTLPDAGAAPQPAGPGELPVSA